MLKSATNGTPSARPPSSTMRKLPLDSSFQDRTSSLAQSGSPNKWRAYINGGAQEDDARMLQKGREEDAEFQKARRNDTLTLATEAAIKKSGSANASQRLIETWREKSTLPISDNVNRLVDIGTNDSNETHQPQRSRAWQKNPAQSQGTTFGGPEWSLLD